MLLVEPFFESFVDKPIADARKSAAGIVALSAPSRADVDAVVEKALAHGARRYSEPRDDGFMYQWGFEDLDGHVWEHFWMDPKALEGPRDGA